MSVADAFDAMTTDRPYSKAMTFEAALARLRFLAGKKFDAGLRGRLRAGRRGRRPHARPRRAGPRWPRASAAARHVAMLRPREDGLMMQRCIAPSCLHRWPWPWARPPRAPEPSADAGDELQRGPQPPARGPPDLALEEFKKAVQGGPQEPVLPQGAAATAYLRQAAKCDERDRRPSARRLELNPYYVDVRNDLGTALILSGKRDEGKKEFLTAFNDPTNPTPEISARNLGQAYFEEKNYPEAINWFRTSLNRNKSYPDAYLGLADALVAIGQARRGAADAGGGGQGDARRRGLQLALGEAYSRGGPLGRGAHRLEEARRKDPAGRRAAAPPSCSRSSRK